MTVREYVIAPISFHADAETAEAVRARMELAVNALLWPTKENASALFAAGAVAIVAANRADTALDSRPSPGEDAQPPEGTAT